MVRWIWTALKCCWSGLVSIPSWLRARRLLQSLILIPIWIWTITRDLPTLRMAQSVSITPSHLRIVISCFWGLGAILWIVPKLQTWRLAEEKRFELENEARRTLAQIGGALLLVLGASVAWLQFSFQAETSSQTLRMADESQRAERDSKLTERFSESISQLSSDRLDARVGAVYALERLSHADFDQRTIVEVLTAFVRQKAPWTGNCGWSGRKLPPLPVHEDEWPEPPPSPPARMPLPAADVQAALTVLARNHWKPRSDSPPRAAGYYSFRMDLTWTNLKGADLVDAQQLQRVDLTCSNLEGAMLHGAQLKGAKLDHANLSSANLNGASLEGASLRGTAMPRARLDRAVLTRAFLLGTDLRQAEMSGAKLENAYLESVDLSGARLSGSKLTGATIRFTKMAGALQDVDIRGVDLRRAYLWTEDLEGAIWDETTVLMGVLREALDSRGIKPPSPAPSATP